MTCLPCVEIEPASGHTANAAVIWLHGLGANGHDFEPIVPQLTLSVDAHVRFVFPHAPSLPVTINNGMVMPAWYDILAMDVERQVDESQLRESARSVQQLIDREIERGIDSQRIMIMGFSQGGAVGYEAALSYSRPLCGLMALSTYFATYESIECHPSNNTLAVMIMHGSHDGVVPEVLGRKAMELLERRGFPVEYKKYPMEHTVCPQQVQDISEWISARLASQA